MNRFTEYTVRGFGQQPALRFAPNEDGPFRRRRDDRRQQRVAALVADHDRLAVLDVGDEAVGGAEIDADDSTHCVQASVFWALGLWALGFVLAGARSLELCILRELPINPRQQVIDVIPFEHSFTQGAQHLAAFNPRSGGVRERIPPGRELLQLRSCLAFGLNRLARPFDAAPSLSRRASPAGREPRRALRSTRTLLRAGRAGPVCGWSGEAEPKPSSSSK